MKVKVFAAPGDKAKDQRNRRIPWPLPQIGQHCLICAPTGSGKSQLVLNLLTGPYREVFDRVWFFMPTWDFDIYKDHIAGIPDEQIIRQYTDEKLEAIEAEVRAEIAKGRGRFDLIVLDDSMDAWRDSKKLNHFMTLCRHFGLTVWTAIQYVHGAVSKLARQQFSSCICFASAKEADVELLAELSPTGKKAFHQALMAVRARNVADETSYHTLHMNSRQPRPFFLDLDVPVIDGVVHDNGSGSEDEAGPSERRPAGADRGGGSASAGGPGRARAARP